MATGLPFGARAERAAQTRVLRAALGAIRPRRPVAAFDIDSTILVNKVRQARIVREYGQLRGDRRLAACQPEAVVSWDLRDTLRLCGLNEPEIAAIVPNLGGFWRPFLHQRVLQGRHAGRRGARVPLRGARCGRRSPLHHRPARID